MSISKFDRREETRSLADAKRALDRKKAEIFRRKIGWVVFFIVVIVLFILLWRYLGSGPLTEPLE
ncbi:MAG: hypothetical protein GXP25_04805 [Planctomycetes bacterium]|nr:hypothetical protein [Planctomycetota bacterium]